MERGNLTPIPNDDNSDDLGYSSNIGLAQRENAMSDNPMEKDAEKGTGPTKGKSTNGCCPGIHFKGEKLIVALTIGGVIIGIALGCSIRAAGTPSPTTITLVMFPGELLMRMLKMLIIPIIATSIVTGLASLDLKKSGRMGGHAILYYLTTTLSAVILGIILVTAIHPGDPKQRSQKGGEAPSGKEISTLDTYLDLVRNVFPENIIAACFEVYLAVLFLLFSLQNKTSSGGEGHHMP